MVGKLDPISRLVKHASALKFRAVTRLLTIVVRCRPFLSADSYYYSNQQFVETGLYRFGKGSECAVADGTVGTPLPSSTLQRAANAPIIFISFFSTKISASLAGHSRIPAAVCAKRWVRRRVTTALRTGSDAAYVTLLAPVRHGCRWNCRRPWWCGRLRRRTQSRSRRRAATALPSRADRVSKFDILGAIDPNRTRESPSVRENNLLMSCRAYLHFHGIWSNVVLSG